MLDLFEFVFEMFDLFEALATCSVSGGEWGDRIGSTVLGLSSELRPAPRGGRGN
jgi:hypothetical protein